MSSNSFDAGFPPGTLMPWWSTDTTVPVGWALCNGQTVTMLDGSSVTTPNMIGMYIVGADITGGISTENVNGFANPANQAMVGTAAHTHTYSTTASGTSNTASTDIFSHASGGSGVPTSHTHTASGTVSGISAAVDIAPAALTMPWIMKL